MITSFNNYINFTIFYIFLCGALGLLIIALAFYFSNSEATPEKTSAYECGFEPDEDSRNVFDVRFYIVAMLFLIFDLEVVYFFPWCASVSILTHSGFLGMMDFIIELFIGFYYAWQVGALDWS